MDKEGNHLRGLIRCGEYSNLCAFIDRYLLIVYMNKCSSDCFEYNGEQAIQEGRISYTSHCVFCAPASLCGIHLRMLDGPYPGVHQGML